jgi:hypothetical protein
MEIKRVLRIPSYAGRKLHEWKENMHPVGQTIGLGVGALGWPLLSVQAGLSLALYKATEGLPAQDLRNIAIGAYVLSESLLLVSNAAMIMGKGFSSDFHTNVFAVPLHKHPKVASVFGTGWRAWYILVTPNDQIALASLSQQNELGSFFAANFMAKAIVNQLLMNGTNYLIHRGLGEKLEPYFKLVYQFVNMIKNKGVAELKKIYTIMNEMSPNEVLEIIVAQQIK